jgi:hypothetical protein
MPSSSYRMHSRDRVSCYSRIAGWRNKRSFLYSRTTHQQQLQQQRRQKSTAATRRIRRASSSSTSVSLSLSFLPFFDILEPLETLWEFYVKRDDIFFEIVDKGIAFTKRHSVRALGFTVLSLSVAELLARLGVLGDRGEGLFQFFRESSAFMQDAAEEKVYRRTTMFLADAAESSFRKFRRFNSKSKFAISLSAGALFSQTLVNMATFTVKFSIMSFMMVETLSIVGVIGDPGETLGDWIEAAKNHKRETVWPVERIREARNWFRKHVSFEALEEFIEVAIDEEKVAGTYDTCSMCACFCLVFFTFNYCIAYCCSAATGFAIGSVMAMFT